MKVFWVMNSTVRSASFDVAPGRVDKFRSSNRESVMRLENECRQSRLRRYWRIETTLTIGDFCSHALVR